MKAWFHLRCDEEIRFLREQVRSLSERNDRLTEALVQKSGIDLVLPRPVSTEPAPNSVGGMGTAEVSKWWKSMNSGSAIASAVKVSSKEEQKQ